MNRSAKYFRGKIKSVSGSWCYGSLVSLKDGRNFIFLDEPVDKCDGTHNELNFCPAQLSIEVISETVGQATGLQDKNGKMIYEGDVLEYRNAPGLDDGVGSVVWDADYFSFYVENEEENIYEPLYNITGPASINVNGTIHVPTDWRKVYPCKPDIFEKTYEAVEQEGE